MKNSKILLFVMALSGGFPARAYVAEEGRISATLAPFVSRTDFKGSDSGVRAPYFGGFGLIVNGDVNAKGSLEIGMFHMNKLFVRDEGGLYQAERTQVIHMTMGYRRWLNDTWSAAMTFYSAYSMGDPEVVHSDFPAGKEIDTSARDITEYGLDLSVQADLWRYDKYTVLLDARYSPSLTSKTSEHSNHAALLLGFKYTVQEKDAKK